MTNPQEIELPDGTVLEFPAEMSDEDIASAIETEYGSPRFGQGYRRSSGDLTLGVAPGVDVTVPQEGRMSVDIGGQGLVPSGIRAGAFAGREMLSGVADLAASQTQNPVLRTLGITAREAIPDVDASPAERAVGTAFQYAIPGTMAYQRSAALLANAPRFLRTTVPAISAIGSDFAVTNPDTAATLGDALNFGPTRIEEGDGPLERRTKVAAESALATAGLTALMSGVPRLYDLGRRVISARADVDSLIRDQLRGVYAKGQISQSGNDAVDEARDALSELIGAQERYRSLVDELGPNQAILQIPEELRPFVAGDVPVTPGEYLAARGINVGGLETYYAVSGTEQARAAAASRREATRQALGETLGRSESEATRIRDIAEARKQETTNVVQRLYDDVLEAHRRAGENYESALARSNELLADADELRTAGNIDAAARAEREAASNIRDSLYGAIDPQGRIPLNRGTLDRAYNDLTSRGQLTEELQRANIGFGKLQAVLNRVRRSERMSYRDVLDIQREMSSIIRSANKNNSAFTEDLIRFRNTVRDEYLAEVERASPLAAEVAQAARSFMAEDFAPRFRQLAGQIFDSELRRAEGTGSVRILRSFINNGATANEDAAILNRILMGTRVDDQTLARIAQAAGVEDLPLGRAALETRSAEAYQQSLSDVGDYYTAMLARQLRESPGATPETRARAARRFIARYSDSISQFRQGDGTNPVLDQLEDVALRLEGARTSAAAVGDIGRAASRIEQMLGSVRDINPQNASETIRRFAADMTARGIDNAVYQQVIQDLSATSDKLAARGRDLLASRFADADPGRAVGRVFGSSDPAGEFRQIIQEAGEDNIPALKAAVAEHIIDQRIGSGSVTQSNLRGINDWLSRPVNQRALRQIYSDDEMRALDIMSQQIANMDISTTMRTRAFTGAERQSVFDTLMQLRREFTGATQGMGQQVRVTNQARLVGRIRSLLSESPDTQALFDQRLIEIAHDPRAALAFLEPISEERAIREIQALILGGRNAYLALHSVGQEQERQERADQYTEADLSAL